MIHIFNFSRFPISPNMMYSVRVSHPFTAPAASQGCPTKSKVEVDVDVSITLTSDSFYIFLYDVRMSFNFQYIVSLHLCTKKNKKTAFCTPCYVQVPVVHILVGPINLPQSSSLQSPDPRSSSSLQPLLISQPTKLFIHY